MITCVLLLAGYASSATRTWNGGGANNNWSTTANWTPATAPTTGDDLVFAGSTRLGPVNDIASGTTFNSISFSSGAGNFNLTGNPLNLSGGATALTCNATTGTMMIQLTITYTAAPTVANPGAGSSSLMIFDQVTGGYTINVAGTGTVDFAGPITGTGGISKNGTGTLKLQGGSSFTGAVNIATGLVIVTNPSGLGSTSAGTTVQSGAAIEFGNVNYSAAEPLTLNGTGISTNGAMTNNSGSASTFGGPITLASATSIVAGTGNLTLSNTTAITGSFALTLGGAAIGTMSAGITGGAAGLTKAGAGTWNMNGSGSSSTGTVTVSSGTLEITGTGSIPLGDITLGTATFAIHDNGSGNNGVIDYNRTLTTTSGTTASLYVTNAGANTGNSIKFNGYNLANSTLIATGANGYKLELGSLTLNGGTSGTATLSSGTADFIIGNVTGNAQTHTLALAGTGGGSRINGILSDGAAAVTVTKAGAGAWTLAGSNTYTGTTSVSAGALVVAANNALGSASAGTTISSGAVLDLSGTNYAAAEPVTLNGTGIAGGGALVNTNVAGASFAGPITLGSASSIVGASGTIALGNTGAISGSYGLTLGGTQGGSLACTLPSGNLTKSGTGTWTLSGSTALSLSSLTLSAGTLALGSGLNHTVSTTVSVTGGTLDFGSSTLDVAVSSLDLSALAGMVPGTGSLKFSSGSAQALIAPAVGLPNLTKINAGTLTVGNAALNAKTLTLNGGTWDWGSTPRTHYLTSITGAGGNMDFAADTVEVSGDVSLGGLAGILSGSTGYLKFNNPGSQSFQPKAGAAHPNLIKTGVGTVTLITNNLICASLSITNGTFGFGTGPLTLTSNGLAFMNGGTLDVSTNTPTLVTGGWLDVTAGTLIATNGTLDANSSVIVRSGSTFLCPATNPFTIRENLSVLSGATFTTNSGTITMDATSGGQDVASVYPLNNLVFNGTGGGWIPSMAMNVNGTLTVSAGTLNVSVVSGSVTAGNLTMGGGTFTATNATLDINGDFSMTGGTFDIPTSAGNFKVAGSYVQSAGSMTSGVGAVRLDGTGTGNTVTATATLNVLEITGSGSWSLGSNLTVNTLSQSAGSLNLASNILNINSGNTFSGGTLNFGSGALHTMASTVNLNGLGTLVAGTGTLRFSGSSAQTFTPKASVTHPNLTQYGAGGTTVATNGFTTDVLTLNQGTFNLGSGLSHTASTVSDGGGGPYGSLDFGSSQLHVMGNIALGNLTSLVAGSGALHFDGASGSQFFTPKSGGAGHPHIVHTTGTEIRLFTNPLTCLSFTMSNGSLDFNGQNLATSGNLSITSGTPSTITGLGGRTLTVGGTATLNGASAASKLNLNPGTAWTLNATGAASATYASLNYGTATNPATCSNCTEGGNNANWSFPVTWDGGGSGNSWGTADNWGSKTVPTSVQSVIFNGTSVKDVVLNAAATIYAITMTGAYTGNFNFNGNTLTVQEGNADFRSGGTITGAAGNLSLSGAAARLLYPFSGTGLPNLQHAGAGSLTVTGGNLTALNLTLSGAGAFNLGTGLTHNFAGISGSGWLTFGTASVNATGDVDLSGMSVTASGTNTLAFTGASAQNFTPNASVSGLKLTQNGAGGTLVQGYNFLTDTLTLAAGTFNLGAGRTHITTSITASGGTLHFGSSTLKVSAASVSLAGLGTLNAASGTLEFNGASAQTFVPKSGATHPTLRQNGAGGTTLLANITANGLELNSGILNLGNGLWMVADGFSTGGGGLDFGTSTLRMSGATINLNGLSSLSAAGGTLEFTSSSAQAFTPKTATNSPALLQTGTGVTTLGGNVSTSGLSINGGEINLASYALSASGNLSVTGGVLTATNGSLDVDGNLIASGGTVKFPSANPLTVAGNIAITSGATVIHNSGTLTLDGTASGLTLSIDNAVNSLVVNGTGGEWTATGSSFTADGALSLVAGALKLGTGLSHLVGSVTSSGGTLDFGSSTLRVNYGSANLSGLAALVADAGTLHFLHTGAQVFTPKSGATHPLILKSGAGDLAISAYDLTTKGFNLSAGGLNLNGRNITVNNGGNFSLTNGGPGTISNLSGSTLTVAGSASFAGTSGASRLNLNPGANWTLNVSGSLTANYVTLSYANASGSQGQCSNCANAGSNSNWNFITVWDGGGADENWSTPANWGSDAVPTAAEDVSFTGLSTKNVILDANGTVKSLTMVTAYTGAFDFGSSSMSINGNADFRSGGAITPGTGLIYLNGTGSNTFIPKAGATFPDIVQNGAGGTTTITTNALSAGNLTINSSSTLNLGTTGPHTVASITGSGTLNFSSSDLNIQGNALLSSLTITGNGRTLYLSGTGGQTVQPNASVTTLKYRKTGTGVATLQSYGLTTDSLYLGAGTLNLGTGGLVHNIAQGIAFSGGTLDFSASQMNIAAPAVNFSSLAGLTAGTGSLHFTGASAQIFTPRASTAHPGLTLSSAGGGGVSFAADLQSAASLTIQAGTLSLGAGTHTILGNIATSGGGLNFGSAALRAEANADLSGLVSITAGSGILRFTGTGTQTLTPRAADTLPAIEHSSSGTLAFSTNPVICAAFTQSAGALDLGGQNLSTQGDLSLNNGTTGSFVGLAARTLVVGGNASISGTSGGNRVNLNPGAAWTLAVTGTLTANLATLANGTASVSAGVCTNCANAGTNTNWSFSTIWDGGGGNANWTTATNWGSDTVPAAGDDIIFNAGNANATLNSAATVKSITFTTGYTGNFNFSISTLTINGGGADFRSGGAIIPGSGTLAFASSTNHNFHPKSGGTFPAISQTGTGTTTVVSNPLNAASISLSAGYFHLGTAMTHTVGDVIDVGGALNFGTSNLNATGNVDMSGLSVTAFAANVLAFTGASPQTFIPYPSALGTVAQTGSGGTTVQSTSFTVDSLHISAGSFNLGTGLAHTASAVKFTGGSLDFGSSGLTLLGTGAVNFSGLASITPGTGVLSLAGSGARTFTPHGSSLSFNSVAVSSATWTLATMNLEANLLTINSGTLNLGSGLLHGVGAFNASGGTLNFNTSSLSISTGNATFSSLAVLTPATGTLIFSATSGTQVLTPKNGDIHPGIIHSGPGTLQLAAYNLTCASFIQTAGTLDLNGRDLTTSGFGDLSLTNGTSTSLAGLAGRTLTVGGNASLSGASSANRINLNPGSAWTLAVTGALTATLASLNNNTATVSSGSCANCANGGSNSNWNFSVSWDGGGGNANWSTPANWGSDAVPTAAEDVTFNSGSLGAVLDANASIKSMTMTGGYTGSLDFGSSILSISGNADFRSGGGIIQNTGSLAFTGSGAQTFIPKSGAAFPALVQNGNTGVTTVTTNPLTAGNLTLTLGTFNLGASMTHTVAAISGAGGLDFGTSNLNATGDVNLGTATVAATSASTLAFTNNSTAQIFTPNTSEPDLKVHQNGYGGTTVATNNLSTPSLTISAGTFNLGPGFTHSAGAITATGGGINFNSSTLQFPGASLNLDPLSALMPGSGTLAFTGASAQAFTPKAGTGNMKISLTGSGGVNLSGDFITLGIDIQAGTLDLGTGRSHTVTGGNVTSSGGGLVFNNSVLQAQGSVNFSGLASLSAGSGILRFYTSGTPTFTPKASATHPHIEQTGANTVTLATNALTCLSFTQSAGIWNLGGQNLTTVSSGNFTVTNGAPTSFSGLAGRTLTVAGNASLAGASAGSKLNLDPASAWTLAVTGTLNASFASLMNGTASASAGACASCANGGGNSNWTFSSTWIGGSGSAYWTNAANWSGGVVPAAGEDVIFNATNYDCTLGAAATVRNITLTSGYTGAFYFNIYNLTVTGNADFRTGGTVLPGSATMLFTGTSAQTFIPKAGQTFPNLTQNGAGGTTVLTNPLTAGSLTLTSGTFNLGASLTHSVAAVSGAGGLHFGTSNLNATGNVNLNSATVTATSANTLVFSGASAQTYTPKASVTNLNLTQNGSGVTTVASVNFTTPLLTLAAGTFNLGTSRQHLATSFAATGGTLDFGSASSLEISGATIDFSGLAAITAGDGYLRFGGSGAQTFVPKAGATHPSIWQNGSGTTTVTTNGLIAGSLTPTGGTFHMGTGLTHTFTGSSPGGGPYGSLHFGSSQVHFTGHTDFSSLTTVTAGTGSLHFDAPTGTQIFAPKAGTTHAAVTHAGAGTLQLATNNLACAAFTQSGGPLDLNGRNIQTVGNFTVGNGTATTFTGLAARTITVGGNATFSGASTGSLLNLNPGSAWTLAVTGSLNASLAALANGNASVSAGTCTNCSDGGGNTNWASAISWDGGGADNNWSTTANWGLDAVPTSADNIVFDATSVKNATLDATGNVASIKFTSGYTGTFSFVTNNVVIHTGNADMRTGGAFSAGSGMLYFQGTGAQSLIPPASGTLPRVQRTFAGTLTFATNGYSGAAIVVSAGTINLGAGLSHSANLVDGNSGATLDFGTSNLTLTAGGTADFADITVTAAGSNTLFFGGASAMTFIPGPGLTTLNLAQTGTGTTTVTTNDFTVPTLTLNAGTLNLGAGRSHSAATISAGGGALDFGSSALTFTGSSLVLTGLSAITAGTGYLTLSSSGAQTLIPKSGATLPDLTKMGAGTITIATNPLDAGSLTISGGTVNLGSSLTHTVGSVTVTGTLDFSGANLNAKGNVSLSGGTVTATSANTLAFIGTASQNFSPNASEPDLNLVQNGTGGTTALAAITTPTLTIVAGTLYLGTGLVHTVGSFAATGGGLDFETSQLSLTGTSQDFSALGAMTPGTGTLAFTGASAQTFTPKAAHSYPAISQNGTGGTTIAANNLTAGALSIDNGTLNLGAGRTHSVTSISTTNGGIHFNSSVLNVTTGNAMLANLGTVTAGTGTLAFSAASGTQVLTPKAGQTHPAIYHFGAGAFQLAVNDLSCASFSNSAGALDLNGRNLATTASGNFTVSNGTPATFTGLAGRTLTVAGNASLSGTSAGSKLNLNPGAGWTLAVTGTLTGAFATVMNGTASGSGGACSDCVNGGTNTNWSFLTSWDGGGADNNWTTAGNWGGDAVPTASDAITFNGTSVKDATLDADATVKSITFSTAYTGAFSFTTRKLTLAAGDADFRSGGTFSAGTGVLEFASSASQSLIPKAGAVFPDILQSGAGGTTVAVNALNAGSLAVTAGSFNLGSAMTHAVANVSGSGSLDFGTSDLQATGNVNLSALTVTAANSNTLTFLNTAARTFTPNASQTTLRLSFGGSAAVTTAVNGFTTPALTLSAGSLILGSGLIHTVIGTVAFTGGGLDFNGGTLRTTSATVDLRGLATLAGNGNLEMTGASPQTLHPKAGTQHPNLRQNGAGGTTLASNSLQAGSLMIDAGTLDLGSGFTHNVATITGAGGLAFNTSTLLVASGDADLSGFAVLNPGTGTLRFGSPSGTQILSPKASTTHPSISHTGAGTLRLAANDLACATFSQSAGTLDLNGRNLTATGDFTLTAGHPASFAGLGGRTLTVSGNVSVTGASGSQVNLDPATAWTLAASGTLTVTFANVARGTASASAGTAVNSADGGSNANWTFAVSWTGGGADEFWSTGANWGSGSAPGITTNVIFDATNGKNSQLTANASAKSISFNSGYTGAFSFGGFTLTIGDGNADFRSGGAFTAAGGTLEFGGTANRNFHPKAGSALPHILHSGTGTTTVLSGALTASNLALAGGTLNLGSGFTHTVGAISGSGSLDFASSSVNATGNVDLSGLTVTASGPSLNFTGASPQSFTPKASLTGLNLAQNGSGGTTVLGYGFTTPNLALQAGALNLGAGLVHSAATVGIASSTTLNFASSTLKVAGGTLDFSPLATLTSGTGLVEFTGASAQGFTPKSGAVHPILLQSGAGGTTVGNGTLSTTGALKITGGTLAFSSGTFLSAPAFHAAGGSLALSGGELEVSGDTAAFNGLTAFTTGTGTVKFSGAGAKTLLPKAGAPFHNFVQNGSGAITIAGAPLVVGNVLLVQNGPLLLGTGMTHQAGSFASGTAGNLDFGSSTLQITSGYADFTQLTSLSVGTGLLEFTGTSAHNFQPKASLAMPAIRQNGAGTTTLGGNLTAGALSLTSGQFHLGAGRTHSFTGLSATGGDLDFGSSQMRFPSGNADFSGVGFLVRGTGSLHFDAATGIQQVSGHGATALPPIFHAAAGTLRLANNLATTRLDQTAGILDFAGRNLMVSSAGDFTVANGAAGTLINLDGITITVTGNASLTGQAGSHLALNPASPWILDVAGVLTASYADLARNTAATAAGSCSNCANGGTNANWTFAVGWDGGGADENWTTAANWGSDAVPTAVENVTFDAGSVKNVSLNADATVNSITMGTGYTGAFSFLNRTLTVNGTADFRSGGTFVPGTGAIAFAGTGAQAFHPKPGATFPNLVEIGGGTTTVTGTDLNAGDVTVSNGTFHLGTGASRSFKAVSGSGTLDFGASHLSAAGNVDLSALTVNAPSANRLYLTGAAPQTYRHRAGLTSLFLDQTGAGGTTLVGTNILVPGLSMSAGALRLGTGLSHTVATKLTLTGGELDFGSSALNVQSDSADFRTVGTVTPGTGTLAFAGFAPQVFLPKAGAVFPSLIQNGAGTTVAANGFIATGLTLQTGAWNLGAGLVHTLNGFAATGGSLAFGSSTLAFPSGSANFSGLATITGGTGKLVFSAASGTQTLTPKSGSVLPAVEHTGAGQLRLMGSALSCTSLKQAAGGFDFNGFNVDVAPGGFLSILGGGASTLAGLSGRTLTVLGDATLRGMPGDRLNLNPGAPWTLNVSGILKAVHADLSGSLAAGAAGIADSSVNLGGNANWTFIDTIPPAAVTGFLARKVGGHAVELSWTGSASSDADSVMLRYRTDGTYPANRTDGSLWRSVPKTRAIDTATGLPDKALYHFAAFARDSSGNFALPAGQERDTAWLPDVTPPVNVTGFAAVVLGPTTTELAWISSASADADSLMIRYRVNGAFPADYQDGTLLRVVRADRIKDTTTGLTGNVLYHFGLFARDSSGNWCAPAPAARDTALYQAPVTGSLAITDNLGRTKDADPALAFTHSGADSMRFSQLADTALATWTTLRTLDSLNLAAGADGKRIAAAQFKNIYGRRSLWYLDTTLLDRTAPVISLGVTSAHSWRNWPDAVPGKAIDSTVGTDSVSVVRRRVSDGAYFNGSGWTSVADTAKMRADSTFSVPMPNSAMATGFYDFTVMAKDKLGIAAAPFVLRVNYTENRAPETAATNIPDTAFQNQAVAWKVELGDRDASDSVLAVSASIPAWLTMSQASDTAQGAFLARRVYSFSGKPAQADVGSAANLTLQVRDLGGKTFLYTKNFTVIDVNDAPVFAAGQDSLKPKEDSATRFVPKYSDLDSKDRHSLALLSGPAWAAIEDSAIAMKPGSRDVGPALVRVTVSDGKLLDTLDLAVNVQNVNDVPVAFPGPKWASPAVWKEDVADTFTVVVVDMDKNDPVALKTILPPFLTYQATIDSSGYNRYFRFATAPAQKDTGSYSLKLRFQDASGAFNELALNAKVAAVNDTPSAVVVASLAQAGAARITLSVQDQDGGAAETRFHYRLITAKGDTVRSGICPTTTLSLHPLADGQYKLAIAAEDEGGLRQPAYTLTTVSVSGATSLALDSARWNMIGYPGRSLTATALGAGATLTTWDESASDGSPLGRYATGKSADSLVRGKGYWVRTARGTALEAPLAELLDKPFALKLTRGKQGWNQIGNPYPYYVDLSATGLVYWEWDAARRDLVNSKGILKPWGAYWVQVAKDTLITIKDQPWFNPAGASQSAPALAKGGADAAGFRDARNWSLQLALAAGPYRDEANFLGIRSVTSASPATAGMPDAPKFGDYIALHFEKPGTLGNLGDSLTHGFAADFRASLDADDEWWDFSLENAGTGMGTAQLALPGIEALEAQGLHVFIVDRGEALAVTADAPATLAMEGAATHYSLVVTPHPDFASRLKGNFSISQNFPNPVLAHTTFRFFLPQSWDKDGKRVARDFKLRINVYDFAGRQVAQVASGSFRPGSHSLVWKPVSQGGGALAKGAYVYRLEVQNFTKSLKLLVE